MSGNLSEESIESRLAASRQEVSGVTPERRTEVAPGKTETEQLAKIGAAADSEFGAFETQGQRNLEETVKAGADLGFSASEVETRLDSTDTRTTLDRIKNAAADAYRNFRKVLAVGAGAAILTAAPETRSRFVPEETLGSSMAQVEVLEQRESAASSGGAAARPRPELAKDNPQRNAFESYEEYQKYVEAMRDKEGEQLNEKQRQEWIQKALEMFRVSRESRAIGNEATAKEAERLGNAFMNWRDKVAQQDPGLQYQAARQVTPEQFAKMSAAAQKAYSQYDTQREWLADVVHSSAYEQKARESEGLTTDEIERRKKVSLSDNIRLVDPFHQLDEDSSGVYTQSNSLFRGRRNVAGKAVLAYGHGEEDTPVAVHEGEHAVTDSKIRMSERAKKLYSESYEPKGPGGKDEYYSKPWELDARKRTLEYDLERNGVWKYGQPFTEEHLRRALELGAEGKLEQDSVEFLRRIKLEKVVEIMNAIAENRPEAVNKSRHNV